MVDIGSILIPQVSFRSDGRAIPVRDRALRRKRMRRYLVLALACAALVAATLPAAAQRTTGDLRGVVSDNTGGVLPGVTVTLTGPGVPGTPTTVTNETGVYRFPSLPPGIYSLTFELAGFATLRREQLTVALGGTTDINVAMQLSTQQETITVTGEAPVVDATTTQVSTNYNREWVENAPVRRFTFFDLINAAPGVSQNTSTSSRSQSFGSATNENSYLLDGTDFTAPLTGAAWPWPNTDAIEEVQVLSLGATAEYGNLAGAVFNVVTRQGSNQYHGDANYYLQRQKLTGRNTTDDQDDGLPYNREKFNDITVQLGGPVVKDKFWFFGSFQYQEDNESQPGTPPEFPARSNAKRYFFKLNYQINDSNKIQYQQHDDYYEIPGRATAAQAPSTISVENGHNPSPGFMYTSVLNNSTVFEARYSGFYGTDHGDPLNSGPRVAPRFYDLDSGNITGGIYAWYDGTSEKTAFSSRLTKYADSFLGGSHDFKVGVQYNSGGSDYVLGYNDYIYTYSGVPAYGYTQLPFHQGGRLNGLGVYADDTFRVNDRLTLNLGLRYDWSKGSFRSFPILDRLGNETGASSPAVSKLFDWSVVSPRLGFTLKLNSSGNSILKGHWGRYYRSIVTGEFDAATPSVSPRFLFDGTYDSRGNPNNTELVSDNTQLRIDPDFENPYTDQYIVSFEQQLHNDLGFSASFVYKKSENQSAWNDIGGIYAPVTFVDSAGRDATGNSIQVFRLLNSPDDRIFQLTNDDRMFSEYKGVNFQVNKRMSNRWQATFGITLSNSEGRLGSSSARSSPLSSQTSTAGVFGQNPNDFVNTDGLLIGDRPVVIKTQLVWEAPFGITTALNYQHQTGRPWGREQRPSGLGISTRILAEPLSDDRRVADWDQVDLRLQKQFNFGADANVAFFGDFLNLFNSDTNESVLDRRGTSSNFAIPSRFIQPRRLMLGAKFRF
jgi:outer membrane receptor protein involved in Fe transport